MTTRDDFDRHLAAWFEASAPSSEPEPLLGQVLARTARTRRRPAWRIPERWIPMSAITTRSARVSQVPWRTVGLLALLVLALVAAGLIAIGRQSSMLPPPFGLAADGSLIYSVNGDILSRAAPAAEARAIITDGGQDSGPVISPDGSRFVFSRAQPAGQAQLWVANADGSDVRRLDVPFRTLSWVDWSPAGDEVFVANENGQRRMAIVPANGSPSTMLDLGMPAQVPAHRPGYPDQILFRGNDTSGDWGLFLVGRDGVSPKRLSLDPGFQQDPYYEENRFAYFQGPLWSSDGKTLLYYTLEPAPDSPAGPGFREHVATIGPAGEVLDDKILEFDPSADDEWAAQWLPAEDGFIFQSQEGSTHTLKIHRSTVSPSDVHDLGVTATDWISFVFSPDGKDVIAMIPPAAGGDPSLELIDLQTFAKTPLDVSGDVTWQRLAP
jgi:hypothetical protein